MEAGGRKGQELRRRPRSQGRLRPDVRGAERHDQDARVQPAHLPAGPHRRDPQGRSVQDRLPHQGPGRAGAVEQVHEPGQGLRLDQSPGHVSEEGVISRLTVLLSLVAWLAALTASHAAAAPATSPEVDAALNTLTGDDADKREAAVATIGQTRDPKWIQFLAAL